MILERTFLTSIIQAALMIFVLDSTIGIGVWLPFTIGKSLALLSVSVQVCLRYIVADEF